MAISERDKIIQEVQLSLGAPMVNIELDISQLNFAVDKAISRYRLRSDNANEEAFLFIELREDTSEYYLPNEVQNVRAIYRRTMGSTSNGTGAAIDPFSLAGAQNLYTMAGGNPGGLGFGGSGGLALYDFALQYQALAGRMFGRDLLFNFSTQSKKLTLHRKISGREEICCHIFNSRPEEVLLTDVYARTWLRDYALASAKMMLGEVRGKFASLAGPSGGITLSGDSLKASAAEDFTRLELEITQLMDQDEGYGLIIG